MKKYILDFVCKLEGYKTAIKQLHWDAKSLSQHQLCDDIAGIISDYQDKVAEVEQSMSGRLPLNNLKGTPYTVSSLKKFVDDVISSTNDFYAKLKNEGDDYIGMRSDTEAVLSDLQRQLYLVDFTIKEGLKERLRNKINENRVTISDGRVKYNLTENELREYVSKAIRNLNEHHLDSVAAKREMEMYLDSLKDFALKTKKVYEVASENGIKTAGALMEILKTINKAIEYIQMDGWTDENIEAYIDGEANMDDFPPIR